MRCYRCREYNHFASECPNTPTDRETDYEDVDPASLQMISQDYGPAMACFHLLRVGYDTEVICIYGTVRNLSYCISSFITYYYGM